VWVIPRTAIQDDEIDGHHIPKGSIMIVSVNAVHHDPRWWDDPGAYDPSRFMPDADKDQGSPPLLLPAVRRRAARVHRHELRPDGGHADRRDDDAARHRFDVVPGHPVQPEATLTLRPRNGVRMIAHQRTAAR
jgi:hypothetical protein